MSTYIGSGSPIGGRAHSLNLGVVFGKEDAYDRYPRSIKEATI
ncbi:MAG: hypothetical protein M0Z45_07345 [Actinomycetota bacterium]|nr:hypothetical protein [Actinomycetota bacterium]